MPEDARQPTPPDVRELLLLAARLERSAKEEARLAALAAEDRDWAPTIALAERNGVLPLLAHALLERPGVHLPGDVARELQRRRRDTLNANLRLSADLLRVVDLLASRGIESLPYKGPTLALQAYGNLGLRRFVDLDLLVRPDDAPRALEALAGAGYESVYRLTPAQDAAFRRVDGDYPLVHRESGALLELHCRVSSERFVMDIDTDRLMRRAVPVRLGGAELRAPAADDLLVTLCAHGAKHRWKRLEWVAAVAEILRRGGTLSGPDVAPDRPAETELVASLALDAARQVRAERTVRLGFALAHRLLGARLPKGVLTEIEEDRTIARLAAESEARMFDPSSADDEEADDTAANLLFNLRARDSAADRARYAWRWLTLPSPEDWGAANLPDALFPVYRVTRPLRLFARYAPRPFRR